MTARKMNYKEAMAEIEQIVQKVENEEVDIDELSKLVKRAAELIKQCKAQLKTTGDELEKIVENLDE